KFNLPGGMVERSRKMILLMAPNASSPPVFPVSNNNEPCAGNTSDNGTEMTDGPGHFRRGSLGMASTNCTMSTSSVAKFTAFWNPEPGVQLRQDGASHDGNNLVAAPLACCNCSQSDCRELFQSASSSCQRRS